MSGSEWKTRPGPLSFLGYVVRHRTSGNPARSSPPTTFVPSLRPSLSLRLSPPLPSFLLLFSTLEHGFLATLNTTVAQLACLESQQRFPNLYFVQGIHRKWQVLRSLKEGAVGSLLAPQSLNSRGHHVLHESHTHRIPFVSSQAFLESCEHLPKLLFFFLKRGLRLLPRNRDICICSHA